MTRTFAEILILNPSTLTTGYLMFVATVLQRAMNELDEATFGRFVLLLRKATRSVYAVLLT
jgi:membrane protein CcdC involved in cytochrome C biogenesis